MFGELISHLEKPLTLQTKNAAILADVRLKQVTSRSSHSYSGPSINTTQFPGLQIHLCHIRVVLISVPNVESWTLAY